MAVECVADRYVRAVTPQQRRLLFDRPSVVAVHLPELASALGERIMRRPLARLRTRW